MSDVYYDEHDLPTDDELALQIEYTAKTVSADTVEIDKRAARIYRGLKILAERKLDDEARIKILAGIADDFTHITAHIERFVSAAVEGALVSRRFRGQRDAVTREYERLLFALDVVDMNDEKIRDLIVAYKGLEDSGELVAEYIDDAKTELVNDIQVKLHELNRDVLTAGAVLEAIIGERELTAEQESAFKAFVASLEHKEVTVK